MTKKEVNIRRTELWKSDSWASVEFYNKWFIEYAPKAFREARNGVLSKVMTTFKETSDLSQITTDVVLKNPQTMEVLRMITAPPLAQDRLTGLSYVKRSILKSLERGKLPKDIDSARLAITRMINTINMMIDNEIFPWLSGKIITLSSAAAVHQ